MACIRSGNGDQKTAHVVEPWRMALNHGAKAAAELVAIMGLAAAFGGDKAGADGRQRLILKGTEDEEFPGFGPAVGLDLGERCTVADALGPGQAHEAVGWDAGRGLATISRDLGTRQRASGWGERAGLREPGDRPCNRGSAVLDGVALVMGLNAFGDEAFAAFLAAAAQDVTAGLGGHAGTETKLVFPGALGRLVGAFAHDLAS